MASHHHTHDILGEYREQGGGSVDMDKDEVTGIATVTLNNPAKRNAVSGKMMVDFHNIVSDLECWEQGRGVVIQGEGASFCSGADLALVEQTMSGEDARKMYHLMAGTLNRLLRLPLLSLAAVQGHAIGGGAEIMTACDFRLMSPGAKVGFVHKKMGVTTAWGGAGRLVQIVGRTTSLDLLATGDVIGAERAKACGLVQEIIDDDDDEDEENVSFKDRAKQWLMLRTDQSPVVVQAQKKNVLNACSVDLERVMRHEEDLLASLWGGPDHGIAISKKLKHK